ncbi:Uncharacterised protein [Collinsella intestinalis]|uniref:Uncharacterized protein n=1 Tax=Collinsella intestinalis TaxID=147207 RepID=A0A5K1JCA6_9ACTN|nr:Uncharacterised protein [Collinsella intestinalis]
MGPALSRHHRHGRALELRGIDFSQAQKRPIRRSAAVFEHLVSNDDCTPPKSQVERLAVFRLRSRSPKTAAELPFGSEQGFRSSQAEPPASTTAGFGEGSSLNYRQSSWGSTCARPQLPDYSNSIVPQGFGVRSYRTRQMPSTSEAMRSPIFLRSAQSSSGTSAVIASTVLTARMNAGHS